MSATTSSSPTTPSPSSLSSLPVPEVSKRVEEGLLEQQRAFARSQCRAELQAFVDCTNQGVISVVWRCRGLRDAANDCLRPYTSVEVLNQMKRDYVAERAPFRGTNAAERNK